VPAQELHSIFRLLFETFDPKAMHYMDSCILQSLSSFHQRKRYCILHYGVWFCFVVGREKRICKENETSIPRKNILWGFYGLFPY